MSCTLKVNFCCSAIQTHIKQTPTANIDEDDNEEIVGFKSRRRLKPPQCSDPYRLQGSLHHWHWNVTFDTYRAQRFKQRSPISSSHTVHPSSVTLWYCTQTHLDAQWFFTLLPHSNCVSLRSSWGQRGSRNDDNYHYTEADIRGRWVGKKATEGQSSGQHLVID